MSVRSVPCSLCEGRPMQRLEERTQDGAWVYNDSLPQDLADAWIARDGERAPLRWADAPCPRCGGAGEYEVEFTVARIF